MAQSMKKMNCEMFRLEIRFDEKNFKKQEFKKAAGCEDETHNAFVSHYRSKHKRGGDHAHIEIVFNNEDSRIEITFHEGKLEADFETDDTLLEDSVKELSDFFLEKEYKVNVTSIFQFDEKFESLLQLSYPLLIANKLLREAVVSGHEVEFPKDSAVERIFVSTRRGVILMVISAKLNSDLSGFDVYQEIKRIAEYPQSLVKIKENGHEKN